MIVKHAAKIMDEGNLREVTELNTLHVGDVLPHFVFLDVFPLPAGLRKSAGLGKVNARALDVRYGLNEVPKVGDKRRNGESVNVVKDITFVDDGFLNDVRPFESGLTSSLGEGAFTTVSRSEIFASFLVPVFAGLGGKVSSKEGIGGGVNLLSNFNAFDFVNVDIDGVMHEDFLRGVKFVDLKAKLQRYVIKVEGLRKVPSNLASFDKREGTQVAENSVNA